MKYLKNFKTTVKVLKIQNEDSSGKNLETTSNLKINLESVTNLKIIVNSQKSIKTHDFLQSEFCF